MAFELLTRLLQIGNIASPETDLSKKYSYVSTISNQSTYAPVYAPTTNRTYDVQYNIASGGSQITTKKESQVSQYPTVSPTISPQIITIPSVSQSGSGGDGGLSGTEQQSPFSLLTDSATGIIIVGLIGVGVYMYASKGRRK